jgi:hypothetical protein
LAMKELSVLKKLLCIQKLCSQLTVFIEKCVILSRKCSFLPS